MCCVGVGSSEPQSHFGFPDLPSHQDHLSCSLVISGACEKATQTEGLRGNCGSATFNLILKCKGKKKRKCVLTLSHFDLRLQQHSLKADGV